MKYSEDYLYRMTNRDNEDHLSHHGVKGMKWGIRRNRKKSSSSSSKSADKQIKKDRKNDLKKRRTMSNDELRKRIERLKLEREYKSLTKEDIEPGRKFVSDFMSSAGKKTLTVAAAGGLAYLGKAAMTKRFNPEEAASYIFANPNKKK